MWVKVREVGRGLHSSEIVVEIHTVEGAERLVVDKKSIQKGAIFVGWRALAEKKGQSLIELPRETMSGTWRVWIRNNDILFDQPEALRA